MYKVVAQTIALLENDLLLIFLGMIFWLVGADPKYLNFHKFLKDI
jgi:hypothetical protein